LDISLTKEEIEKLENEYEPHNITGHS